MQLTVVLPLEFFDIARKQEACLKKLEFDQQICVREITERENDTLREHVSHKLFPGHRELCLEIKTIDIRPALELAHPVISTMRLLHPWLVGINFCLLHDVPKTGDIEIIPANAPMEIFWSPFGAKRDSYRFEEADSESFNRLYRGCKEIIGKDSRFKFAVARFNQSYSAKYSEYKLLDWMITLEALFLTGETEKAFRLRSYMAIFLGQTQTEKEEIWAIIKKAYELRGKIVHNGVFLPRLIKVGDVEISREDFMNKIEFHVRHSLRKYVEWKMINKTLNFHKVLDKSIYGSQISPGS